VLVDEAGDMARQLESDGARLRRTQARAIADHVVDLGEAVTLVADDAELLREPAQSLARQRFAARPGGAQPEVRPAPAWLGDLRQALEGNDEH